MSTRRTNEIEETGTGSIEKTGTGSIERTGTGGIARLVRSRSVLTRAFMASMLVFAVIAPAASKAVQTQTFQTQHGLLTLSQQAGSMIVSWHFQSKATSMALSGAGSVNDTVTSIELFAFAPSHALKVEGDGTSSVAGGDGNNGNLVVPWGRIEIVQTEDGYEAIATPQMLKHAGVEMLLDLNAQNQIQTLPIHASSIER